MKFQFMKFVVVAVCHVVLPFCLSVAGFFVLAWITGHLFVALAGAFLAFFPALFAASRYTLLAIGPRFADRDSPPTWFFIARRVLKLALVLFIPPVAVLLTFVGTAPFTPYCVIIAFLAGIPGQLLVCMLLDFDIHCWTWRIRRGRDIQSPQEIQKKIAAYIRKNRTNLADCRPWAGKMVPRELLDPHTLILSMTGGGKTLTIRQDIQWIVNHCTSASNVKLIVFDPKRELYSYILGMEPQVPVFLLDPTDRRGIAREMSADIDDPNQAKTIARLFVPEENSSQPYFARAARRIAECVLRYLIAHASHWNLQDVFMILDDLSVLKRILPPPIVSKYFKPESTLKNTLSTLDTLTSRFETVAACWAKAEKEGRTISLREFEASTQSAILVIPRRQDIAEAVDPTIRLVFEELIQLWLARPDLRFLPQELRPETYVILDEAAKTGRLAKLDDLLLMGRSKGVFVTIAAQDVEALRHEYGDKIANSLLGQCGNVAIFALQSPKTRDYCTSLFDTYEIRERRTTSKATDINSALRMNPNDLYQPGELREHKTLLSAQFALLPRPADTGRISGYFITGGLGPHFASYPFADQLLPPANVPPLLPRDADDQEFPQRMTTADLKRLGIPLQDKAEVKPQSNPPRKPKPTTSDSLRFIKRISGK